MNINNLHRRLSVKWSYAYTIIWVLSGFLSFMTFTHKKFWQTHYNIFMKQVTTNMTGLTVNYLNVLHHSRKQKYAKLFWVLRACLATQFKNNSINLWKTSCSSTCRKYTSSFIFFLRYHILKNPVIWLAGSMLAHNSRIRILPDLGLMVKYQWQY